VRFRTASGRHYDFEAVVRSLHNDVWLLCAHLTDVQTADDVAQDTFLRVYKALPDFRGEANLKTWVLSIARRACADHVRRVSRERRRHARVRDDLAAGTSDQVPDVGEGVALRALLDVLDADRRAAFVLTQLFGLSYQEAASVCECPIGTIRSRVARARADLIEAQGGHVGKSGETAAHRPV
jgi:RNA polymerase sigma-70 factor (ECF subfamily)